MNLDDSSLLSAYLDDEIDAPARAEVEAALRSRPDLRRSLAELADVRELLAGLDRPAAPTDFSNKVVSRLAAHRPRRFGPLILVGVTSLAACLLIARVVPVTSRPKPTLGPTLVAQNATDRPLPQVLRKGDPGEPSLPAITPSRTPPIPPPSVALKSSVRGNLARASSSPIAPTPAPTPSRTKEVMVSQEVPGAPEANRDKAKPAYIEPAEIREFLSNPNVRRLTVTVDDLNSEAINAMNGLVEGLHKKRPRWGNLTVEQTVLIDPARPGRAVIFAMVLDRPERERLDQKLQGSYPNRIQEDQPSPTVLERLAHSDLTGKFTLHQGPAIAGLLKSEPPEGDEIFGFKASQDLPPSLGRPSSDPPPLVAQQNPRGRASVSPKSVGGTPETSSRSSAVGLSTAARLGGSKKSKSGSPRGADSESLVSERKSIPQPEANADTGSKPTPQPPLATSPTSTLLVWLKARGSGN